MIRYSQNFLFGFLLLCLSLSGGDSSSSVTFNSSALNSRNASYSQLIQANLPVTNQSSERQLLPSWFLENRVQGHTRLSSKRWLESPQFTKAAGAFQQLGVKVFVRHVKSKSGDPWWPSKVPKDDRGNSLLVHQTNLVQEIVNDAHGKNLKMIAYYFHSRDRKIADLHPEWVCKQPDGELVLNRKSQEIYLDITSPYREIVLQRLLELAAMGVDGFYFDETHLPYSGCWGTSLEVAYQQTTGKKSPGMIDEHEANYRAYLQFTASQVENTFTYWYREVKKQYPDLVFIVSTTTLPSLINPRMTTNLARISDSPKNEFYHALNQRFNLSTFTQNSKLAKPAEDIRMALGWTLLRDVAEGRPPYIWGHAFPNTDHALGFVGAVVSYGAIANMDVSESLLFNQGSVKDNTPKKALEAVFALGNQVSPYLNQSVPLRWAAVHFSERSRNRRDGNFVAAWREVLWPLTGAFEVFVREGLPIGVVDDSQLEQEQLAGYKLLFLPNPDELTLAQHRSVDNFKANGGIVLENNPQWDWSSPKNNNQAKVAFRQFLSNYIGTAPVRVTRGPKKMHAVTYTNPKTKELVVAITNNFTWVQRGSDLVRQVHQGQKIPNPPPPPISGVKVTVKAEGLPSKIFEVISGQSLQPRAIPGGYEIQVPQFSTIAMLVIKTI